MRRIRLETELIKVTRQGRKIMTLRSTERPHDDYIVEEGGHSYYEHIDSGLRICIGLSWKVTDIKEYADKYFDLEGFKSPQEFLDYVSKLCKGKLPAESWTHVFWAAEGDADLKAGKNVPLAKEIAEKMALHFLDFSRGLRVLK